MDKYELDIKERSIFAQRVLNFLWSHRPDMAEAELARRIGIKRQTLSNWLWNKSVPLPENLAALALHLGCSVEDLQADIEASKNWKPPMAIEEFVAMVEAHSAQWPDRKEILRMLRLIVASAWQDNNNPWVQMARDAIDSQVSLHSKATKMAFIVQARRLSGDTLRSP